MIHSLRFLRAQFMAVELVQPVVSVFRQARPEAADTPLRRVRWLQRACQTVCRMHGLSPRVIGEFPAGPVIYVCNHLGYVDAVAICSLTPCAPIAKSELERWPLIGAIARRGNVIFTRRGDRANGAAALRAAMRRLASGVSVLNFPEGTTTRGEVLQFYRGIFGISALMRIPVVPLALSFSEPELCWVDDESFLYHYSTWLIGKEYDVEIRVGPQMLMRASEAPEDFAARVRDWIIDARDRARSAARQAAA